MIRKLVFVASALVIGLTGCSKKSPLAPAAGNDPYDPRDKGTPTAPATPVGVAAAETVELNELLGNWQLVGITFASQTTETAVDEGASHGHFFSFIQDYDEFKFSYQRMVPGEAPSEGYFSLVGNDLTNIWSGSSSAQHVYGLKLTSGDDLVMPDSNPAISKVKERHYKRISDDNMAYILHSYGIN